MPDGHPHDTRPDTGRYGWVVVVRQTLLKKPVDGIRALASEHDVERLRLAVTGANEVAFDWTLGDDRIVWDGGVDVLVLHADVDRLQKGMQLRAWMSPMGRDEFDRIVQERALDDTIFEFEFEAASAMGAVWFEMRGVRIPGTRTAAPNGSPASCASSPNSKREAQRLTYLATRDELTGHLNRTSLRSELARAIEAAKAEDAQLRLSRGLDRPAGDDQRGLRLRRGRRSDLGRGRTASRASLRGSDVIGRTAGNKLGVIVADCTEREIALVADRMRAVVRGEVIATRSGTVSATVCVGAVSLPSGATSSQEAMLRAEEALDHARGAGRDGFAATSNRPSARRRDLRLMGIADEIVAALNDNRLVFAYQPIIAARTREATHYECLLRMIRPDGTVAAAGQFIPAAEQLGLVRLVDRHALEMTVAQLHAQSGSDAGRQRFGHRRQAIPPGCNPSSIMCAPTSRWRPASSWN